MRSGWRVAGVAAALLLFAAFPPGAFGRDDLSISVTAFGTGATADLGGLPLSSRGATLQYVSEDSLVFTLLAAPDVPSKQAILLLNDGETSVATLVVKDAAIELRSLEGARFGVSVGGSEFGSLDVYFRGGLSAPVLVTVPGGLVLLSQGSVRAMRTSEGVRVSVGDGRATVYTGDLPVGGVAALTGGIELQAAGENSILIAADGTVSSASQDERTVELMRSDRSGIIQQSLLPDLVKVAEQVTEGDIEPPTRGAPIPAVAVAPQVRIPEIVPRGSLASQVISGSQRFATSTGRATAESFIGSGSAALAVVGVRLQRTRITSSLIVGAGVPLTINRELIRPFTIGPLRR